jgi:hypothetical protein
MIVFLDLSDDRVLIGNGQKDRDLKVIDKIFEEFFKRQKTKNFKTTDKIRIVFGSTNKQLIDQSDSLSIDAKGLLYYDLKSRIDAVKKSIKEVYDLSENSIDGYMDFWSYFNSDLPVAIERDISGTSQYSNKLILVSDGCMFLSNSVFKKKKGTYIPYDEFEELSNLNNWRDSESLAEVELLKEKKDGFYNLQVLFLEMSSRSNNKYSADKLLEYIWEDWFRGMGVEYNIVIKPNQLIDYNKIICAFMDKLSAVDVTSIPLKMVGDKYEMSRMDNDEYVKGLKGVYYLVNIRDAQFKKIINFMPAKYEIDDYDKKYIDSFMEFKSAVLDVIESKNEPLQKYSIFVRGSADYVGQKTLKKKLINAQEVLVEYLPHSNERDDLYITELIKKTVLGYYVNADLPELRANFIKQRFEASCLFDDLIGPLRILEGQVVNKNSPYDRNVELILYLPKNI